MISESLRKLIQATLKDWDVPGCAIAVVEMDANGGWQSTVEAFGTRDEDTPMTTQTRVLMASNTKLFTALAIDMLIRRSEGRVKYTTRVRDVIDGFELYDPVASQACTIEDLLCHRSGLARYNELLRYECSSEIPEAIKHFRPAGDFREKYIYNNWLYDLLGLIIERLSGENYKAFVTREILQPLGMTQSTLELSQAHGSGDIAAGYWRCGENASGTGHNLRVDSGMDQGKGLAASAGLWSTAEDMTRWLQFLLSKGETCPGIADPAFFKESIRGRTIVDVVAEVPELSPRLYGLARRIGSYQGVEFVEHGGAVAGIMSQVCVVPGADWGIALLVNAGPWGDLAYNIIKWRAFEEKFGLKEVDWNSRYWERRAKEVKDELNTLVLPTVKQVEAPTIEPSSIAGTYKAGPITMSVEHITRDTFPVLGSVPFFTKKWGKTNFVATHRTGPDFDGALKLILPGREEPIYGKKLDIRVLGDGERIRVKGLMGLPSSYTGFDAHEKESDIVFERVHQQLAV